MAEQAKNQAEEKTLEVKFKCRLCGRETPLVDMRSVTRFVPVLIVCKDCARELR